MSARPQRRALSRLYAKIPTFTCVEGCTECCGPVVAGPVERERAPLLHESVAAAVAGGCASCPYGAAGSCEVYDDRPFICRLYGTVEDLRCPHGRRPDRLFTSAQGRALVAEYRSICGDALAGESPSLSAGCSRPFEAPRGASSLDSGRANAAAFYPSNARALVP
ncbi:hypothetical protein GCM10008179_28470 [Hansschlegelia plantiphila]|uniref:YkgJ family cysteine cluster protein n=1 Tax=Hansschlegelia plantiphila TaxID=374655 RepID=A0A9W6J4H9_9HYPH|nr:hypothetical protein GCM10008179_28470 [Hansschlegelia plantiphila]